MRRAFRGFGCMRRFDGIISGGMWRQIGVLVITVIVIFGLLGGVGCFLQQDLTSTEMDADKSGEIPLLWLIYCHFMDPGDQLYVKDKIFVVAVSLLGSVFMTGLLISTLTNIIERRIERFKNGTIHYRFQNHVVLIGFDTMVPFLIRQICENKEYDGSDIVLQTFGNVGEIRLELHSKLTSIEEKRVSFVYAKRDSREELEKLHITKAREVFILGEKEEYDHDSLSLDCLDAICDICASERRNSPLKCNVLFEHQDTLSAFLYAGVSSKIKRYIDFCPFNYHETWARKILLNHSNKRKMKYPLLDREPIGEISGKGVHLVIVGMSKMGIALATEAAHIAHFPNFITKKKKTRITFIDVNAEEEMYQFRGRYRQLFDVAPSYFLDTTKGKDWQENYRTRDFKYLGDFVDIEWRFVQGPVSSPSVQKLIKGWSMEEDAIMTIAVCLNNPSESISCSMHFPDKVYDNKIPVLVYQPTSSSVIMMLKDAADSDRYKLLYPFGMLDDCYDWEGIHVSVPQQVNYIYTCIYENCEVNQFPERKRLNDEWNMLSMLKKRSNIYSANTIPLKLRSLGINPLNCKDRELSQHEIVVLAEVEHNRWNVEELLLGYSPVDQSQEQEIERDVMKKTVYKKQYRHYDIRAYADLRMDSTGKNARDYDIAFAKHIVLICK